jgi:hypothetical protein
VTDFVVWGSLKENGIGVGVSWKVCWLEKEMAQKVNV